MDKYTIDVLENVLKWFGFLAVGLITTVKYFKYLKTKAAENSVGKTKIKELEDGDAIVKKDIQDLKKSDADKDKKIEKLDNDYTKVIDKIWDFLKPK